MLWLAPMLLAAASAPQSTALTDASNQGEPVVIQLKPGAALGEVALAARALLTQNPRRDLIVEFEGGTYRLSEPLALDARDGGDANRRVTWRAAAGASVVISGAAPDLPWRAEPDGTWSTPWRGSLVRQLFVEGRRCHRARWPREGWLRLETEGPDRRTSFRFSAGDLAPWEQLPPASLAGSELLFLHDWSMSRIDVARIDEQDRWLTATDRIGGHLPFFFLTNFEPHPRYALENVAPGWREPGDWWHDVDGGMLRYRPLEGERLAAARPEAPALLHLVHVTGTAAAPVRNLSFEGLTFAHTRAMSPPGGYAGIQAGFHDDRADGAPEPDRPSLAAVHVRFARGVRFTNCEFRELGASALWIGAGVQGAEVGGCRFEDVGANGLMIGTPSEPEPDELDVGLTGAITCADSTITRCGAIYKGAVGVWIGIARNVHVHHNEVHQLPYTGISLGWIWSPRASPSRGHVIERNHIHHVMQDLSDGGGIYTIGRHPESHLRHNLIHDVPINLGRAGSNGFFIDQGSSELTLSGNVVHSIARSPVRFHMAGPCRLEGNTLVSAESVASFRYDSCDPEVMTLTENIYPTSPPWRPAQGPPLEVGPR